MHSGIRLSFSDTLKIKKKREEKGYQAVPLHPEHEVQLGEGFRNMGKNKEEKTRSQLGLGPFSTPPAPGGSAPPRSGERSRPPGARRGPGPPPGGCRRKGAGPGAAGPRPGGAVTALTRPGFPPGGRFVTNEHGMSRPN